MRCPKCGLDLKKDVRACPECGAVYGSSRRFFDNIARMEAVLLSIFLGTMIVLVLIQILLRNFFNSGISGADAIVRHLLLFVGFIGAGLATREGAHIKIDAASRALSPGAKKIVDVIISMFSVAVCSILVFASIQFVSVEYEGHAVLPYSGIPLWIVELIIPLGYFIIGVRFASGGVVNIMRMLKGR